MLIPCVCAIVYVFSNYGCTKFWPKHQALIKVLIDFSFSQLPIAFVPVFDNFDGVLYIAIYRYNVTFFVLALWKYNDDEGMMMI